MPLSARRTLLVGAFAAYVVVVALVLLGPTTRPGDAGIDLGTRVLLRIGTPDRLVTPERIEVLLNVALLAPLAALGSLIWPSSSWRDWTALGFLLSLAAEIWQGLALAGRSATYSDIVANTTGALLGSLAAAVLLRLLDVHRAGSAPEGERPHAC